MNIQPISLTNYRNQNNTSFKAIIPHNFHNHATQETLEFFRSPDLHRLAKALSDEGKDLHIFYEKPNLANYDGQMHKIPESYDLYMTKKGQDKNHFWLGTINAKKDGNSPDIYAEDIMQKVTGRRQTLEDVERKGIVEYIADGINKCLKI